MAAASNLARNINILDPNWVGEAPGPELVKAYSEDRIKPIIERINARPGLILPESTDPRILRDAQNSPAAWRRSHDPRLHREVRDILNALGENQLVLLIQTRGGPLDMMRAVREQVAAQLPGGYHPHFLADITRQVWLMAGQTGAAQIELRLSSHTQPSDIISNIRPAAYYQISTYDGNVVRDSQTQKASHTLTLGTPGGGAKISPEDLKKIQPEGECLALVISTPEVSSDTMKIPQQMRLNKVLVQGALENTVHATSVSDDITAANLKENEMLQRVAMLDTLAASTMDPQADPKNQRQLVKALGDAIKEISKPDVMAKMSEASQIMITQALSDIATHHPVVKAHPNGVKMALAANKIEREVEQTISLSALIKAGREPSNENTPIAPEMMSAIAEARMGQIENVIVKQGPEAAREMIEDGRFIKSVERQQGFENIAAKLTDVQAKIAPPVRRRTELKSEAPQMEELKTIDPKGTLKLDAKGQKVFRALQEQLKSDPKLRAELSKNKDLAPMLKTLEKVDFKKPQDVAKLAAQIAKLPKEAKAEIADKVAPALPAAEQEGFKQEFAEVTQQITQDVTIEALAPQIQEPLEALQEGLIEKGIQLDEPTQAKIEQIAQQLAEARTPEEFKEIAKQLSEVIAELPAEVSVELPQLKEFSETVAKWESEPAAFDQFVAQHVELHADTQIYHIEQVEAAHLGAEVSAKLEMTLGALQDLPLDEAQQAKLEAIIDQVENIDPAELKEVIAQLGDLMKSLPPEVSAALPTGIIEIPAELSAADLSVLDRVEIPPKMKADISAKLEVTLDALKELPLDDAQKKQLQEMAQKLGNANPGELKEIISQIGDLMKAMPPDVAKQLPPAISEIRESLKSVDLSAFGKTEIAPQIKADISSKLTLTMGALEDAPLRPADRKQLQEITKQLASSDPKEVRQAIKQLDKLVAALPAESKLPPAFTELRESLRAVERPSAKPVEFSPATVSAIRELQQAVRLAPTASGLSLSPRQIEALIKADISKPAVQQQVMQILRSATSASNDNQATAAVQQLQKLMQQPDVKSVAIIQQIQQMGGAPRVQISSIAVLPVVDVPKRTTTGFNVAVTPTTSSGKLREVANDPNAPAEVRMQAHILYLQQLKREKEQELTQQLEREQSQKPAAAVQALQQIILQDLKAANDENKNIQRQLQEQAIIQAAVIHDQVAGVAVTVHAETTVITTISSNQDYQSTTTFTNEQVMAAGAAATVIVAGNESLYIPIAANDVSTVAATVVQNNLMNPLQEDLLAQSRKAEQHQSFIGPSDTVYRPVFTEEGFATTPEARMVTISCPNGGGSVTVPANLAHTIRCTRPRDGAAGGGYELPPTKAYQSPNAPGKNNNEAMVGGCTGMCGTCALRGTEACPKEIAKKLFEKKAQERLAANSNSRVIPARGFAPGGG